MRVLVFSILVLFSMSGCVLSIPFDITTESMSMDLPNTAGAYVEQIVDNPTVISNTGLNITELSLIYTISNQTAFSGTINLYVTLADIDDGVKTGASNIMSVTVQPNKVLTGTNNSPYLIQALKRSKFVVGVETAAIAVPFTTALTMQYQVRARGEYTISGTNF